MSGKRTATTELNHNNWDKDEPADPEGMGTYKAAPKEVLEKRVIKTARRRTQMSGDEAKKSVFSGFGGFNKTQPSSFDFLSKLTNGNKTNGSSGNKNENTVSSSIFTNSSLVSGTTSGLFSIPVSNTAPKTTPAFGTVTTPCVFGISSSSTGSANSSLFTASKADSTVVDSPFNKTSTISKPETGDFQKSSLNLIPSQVSSTIAATTTNKSLFSSSTCSPSSTPFKIQSVSNTTTANTFGVNSKVTESKMESVNDAKMAYYSKLKGLNESVSDWIKKHVVETPLCILTPIFNDYEKYLKEIQEEYHKAGGNESKKDEEKTTTPAMSTAPFSSDFTSTPKPTSSLFASTSLGSNSFAPKTASTVSEEKPSQAFSFGVKTTASTATATDSNTSGFSFGIKPPAKASTDKPTTSPFGVEKSSTSAFVAEKSSTSPFGAEKSGSSQFGAEKSGTSPFGAEKSGSLSFGAEKLGTSTFGAEKSGISPFGSEKQKSSLFAGDKSTASPFSTEKQVASPFPFSSNTSGSAPPAPFSFGIGKKFSFSPNTQQNPENTNEQENENEDEDEPPKVEFTPVVEENSVFDKLCKVFVKKDANYADKGVATLYIKKIENSAKHQLLVRANTKLGNVLVNLVLASAIPTQRMGKNNVMMVCIPTPDAKPPPTPILIRVKTSEEADELLDTLNKYKA